MHAQEELGVDPDEQPSPWTAAISSFVCFAVGALIPLLPYLFGATRCGRRWPSAALGLFVAGALVARFTGRPWWLSGLRQLAARRGGRRRHLPHRRAHRRPAA